MTDTLVEALCGDLSAIRAPRGPTLNARSWQTEAPLRMLLNNLDPVVVAGDSVSHAAPIQLVTDDASGAGRASSGRSVSR